MGALRSKRRWQMGVLAVASALSFLAGSIRSAAAEGAVVDSTNEKTFVVVVPHLGPMLLTGKSVEHATKTYVETLITRNVFPGLDADALRSWGKQLAASAENAPTLDHLRGSGRPLIGIQLNSKHDLLGSKEALLHRADMATAVVQAGGVPVFLPPAPSRDQIRSELGHVDHLLLIGGSDVSPVLQPGVTGNPNIDTNVIRDRDEQEVIRQALDRGLGIHAVCRGSQLLQVTFGGRLIQDIPSSGMTTLVHGGGQHQGRYVSQPIRFERDSALGKALGPKLTIKGPHNHHQAVDPAHVAPGFRVVATAHDGIPEAIEGHDGRVIGVQVHPEAQSKGSALRTAFFNTTMMSRALEHMEARGGSSTMTLPVSSPRAMTLALHSIVGKGTERPTWNIWRATPKITTTTR